MAKKYGGEFSPKYVQNNAPSELSPKKYTKIPKFRFLFWAPIPLFFSAIGEIRSGDAIGAVLELFAFALLITAPYLLRNGLKAEATYNERKVARPPIIPRKLFASIFSALGVGIAYYFGAEQGIISSILFSGITFAAHCFCFGIDPMRNKGMEGISEFETQRVATAVEKGEKLLEETILAASRIGDRKLEHRVHSLAKAARQMFRAVEDDPRDLTSARKFMSIYLKGARDATIKFADFYSKTKDGTAREDYDNLLTDLEKSFNAQRKTMLLENRSDLDIEIEVLRDRLKQEGLRIKV